MSEALVCEICPHHCHLQPGQLGRCRARQNRAGRNVCANAGRLTSLAMDPIEKKPLVRFYPGSWILSAGSYGCNLACPFCQNAEISMANETSVSYREVSAAQLAELALHQPDNLGVAFTYNEPLISFEYIIDTAKLIRPQGLKTVAVTNGCVCRHTLEQVVPFLDAMNIDLKGDAAFYRELGGDWQTVRDAIAYAYDKCHVEITTLVIPGKNDSEQFIREEAQWLASLDPEITLHLSRYFPRYHYHLPPTDVDVIRHLQAVAGTYLHHVYTGNIG